jgi:Ca-activated chloride channel family protein
MRRLGWLALLVAGCGGGGLLGDDVGDDDPGGYNDAASGGGDFGATPGGVKDLRLARELIASGMIPPPEALPVEGMFAEHDLALDGAPCTQVLCLRAAGGVAPDRAGQPRGWLQVALSSNVNPDVWQPPDTTFISPSTSRAR